MSVIKITKTLSSANKSDDQNKHYLPVTGLSSIETKSRNSIIPVALTDIKFIVRGKPFFEKQIQNSSIQEFTINFN